MTESLMDAVKEECIQLTIDLLIAITSLEYKIIV